MQPRARRSRAAAWRELPAQVSARRHKPDYWLLILSALLLTIGLVVVYSISPGLAASEHISQGYFVTKQLIAVGLGIVGFWLSAQIPSGTWRLWAKPLAITALAGCAIVMVTPINTAYPAHRWIRLGSFSFQIAELVNLALIVWLADFLTQRHRAGKLSDTKQTLKPLVALLVFIGVVVAKLQSDLGSAGVMIMIMAMMAFVIGIPLKRVAQFGGLVLILLVLAVSSSAYRRDRLATYLHPESNCQTTGYQSCQALISVGSGGLFGLGLGNSVQAYGYLPEASNDSIFAIIAEKFGFIGTTIILFIYGFFITRLKRIIERTADQFNRLVVTGVLAWFSTQAIINIGAMIGLLPLKGITLPLISQGGTSLVFMTAALGLVFRISRYTSYSKIEPNIDANETPISNDSFDGRGLRRPRHAYTVSRPRT